MKLSLKIALAALFCLTVASCGGRGGESASVRVASLRGPSSVEMIRLIDSLAKEEAPSVRVEIFSEQLIGASLGWTKSFFPYRTDAIQGWDNFPSWGVINNKTWTTLKAK